MPLQVAAQAPILDSLLGELGLEGGDLNALVKGATQGSGAAPKASGGPNIVPRDGNGKG